MTKWLIFILGILVGFTVAVVWRCLIVSGEADRNAEEMFNEWERKKDETN